MVRLAGVTLALAVGLFGCGMAGGRADSTGRKTPAASPAALRSGGPPAPMPIATPVIHLPDQAAPREGGVSYSRAAPAPARIRIPSIGVDSSLAQLALHGDGTIEVPLDFNQAGWYTKGPAPGEPGPAVILGHVDSYTGPAVFARLSALQTGDRVAVTRVDGSQVDFAVQRLTTFSVDSFPTQDVYGATPEPALRLITCGASFSPTRRRYLGNLVVFASAR